MGKKITKIEPVKQKQAAEYAALKRVCAYCRVSTGSAEQKNSFEAQVQYYTRFIEEKPNWILVGIYADEARSGTKVKSRDRFQQMIQDCRQGKIDLILTKSVTRFARNTVDSIHTIRMLKELGVEVYFEKERVGTLSQKSEQLLTILSSIAQGESESISTNSRWSITRRFQNGTFTIGSPAYGYQNDENGNLIIQPEEAVIVRRIFDEYLGGKGSYAIAKELQAEGVPTIRTAKLWQDSVIKGILQNPVYEGDLLYQKTYTTEGVPFTKKHNHGELPKYLVSDNHEPIISREEAEAVRQIYEYRRQKHHMDNVEIYQSRYAFSSRIICGECGSTFRRQKIYIGKPYEKIQWSCPSTYHRYYKVQAETNSGRCDSANVCEYVEQACRACGRCPASPACGTEGGAKRYGTRAGTAHIGKQNTGSETAEPLVAESPLGRRHRLCCFYRTPESAGYRAGRNQPQEAVPKRTEPDGTGNRTDRVSVDGLPYPAGYHRRIR